jgi:hypothetical protein
MIWASQVCRCSLWLCHHGRSVMATHIEEATQLTILSAYYYNRLTRNFGSHILTRFANLIHTSSVLPALCKDCFQLEIMNAGLDIPGGWDRQGPL